MKESYTEPDRTNGKLMQVERSLKQFEDLARDMMDMNTEVLQSITDLRNRVEAFLNSVCTQYKDNQEEQ